MAADLDFEQFYAEAYGRVVAQLYPVVGNLQDAQELAQEAFARALVRWPRIRGYDQPEAWVRRVAFNLAANARQRARRRLAAIARLGPPPDQLPVSPDGLALMEALRRLPLRYREALVLHHLAELPVQQVAAELRVPVATVKTWLARGRRALAALLADDEDADERTEEVQRVFG
jgi:RNA polymerase sigma-70 factor, ECF subfamily